MTYSGCPRSGNRNLLVETPAAFLRKREPYVNEIICESPGLSALTSVAGPFSVGGIRPAREAVQG
jgi:hypothetical protein